MASTSPVQPLWPISAPCCSALLLLSTMEDNDSRTQQQQQRTLFISAPLCLSLISSDFFLTSLWLLILTPRPPSYIDTLTPQSRTVGNKLFKQKVITNLRMSIDKCIYGHRDQVQRRLLGSFPVYSHESK